MNTLSQRRISIERMAEIHRAVCARMVPTDREVHVGDIDELDCNEDYSFGEFLERNRQAVQLYEEQTTPGELFERGSDYFRRLGYSPLRADELALVEIGRSEVAV